MMKGRFLKLSRAFQFVCRASASALRFRLHNKTTYPCDDVATPSITTMCLAVRIFSSIQHINRSIGRKESEPECHSRLALDHSLDAFITG